MRDALGISTAEEMFSLLRDAGPVRSWVHREFSVRRQYFTATNAMAIDGARREIERWHRQGLTTEATDLYLRACLIDAADRVANTAGTYYAHLKHWTPKALKQFELRPIQPVTGPSGCKAYVADVADLVGSRHFDVLYLDPPYNARDYAGYYHLPETIATGRRPRARGVSGIDAAPRPISAFTRPRLAETAMEELIELASCRLMVVHYSDEGLIPPGRLRSLLKSYGSIEEHVIEALGYGTSQQRLVRHRIYLVEP
jgi:adenine-specific DNA-methyltransferase